MQEENLINKNELSYFAEKEQLYNDNMSLKKQLKISDNFFWTIFILFLLEFILLMYKFIFM